MTSDLNATFGHRPFIKDRREALLRLSLPRMGNAIKLSGRTFLAPHRGSSPKGEARRYVANDFLNLIALPAWERGDRTAVDRVLSFILDLRRISSLFFIPLVPYPARSARHLPHAGKALSVVILFLHVSCIRFDDARKAVFSFRCLPHWGRGTAQRWIGYSRLSST